MAPAASHSASDVAVIGGGVIGLTLAYELSKAGAAVVVLEQGRLGGEASWAGAGILPPGNPRTAADPEALLRGYSHRLWPELSAELRERTRIDNGFRISGGIDVFREADAARLGDELRLWQSEDVPVESLGAEELRRLEPALADDFSRGLRLPTMAQVRNPRHLKALASACAELGVRLLEGQQVLGFERRGGRIAAARTPSGPVAAGQFCVTAGAWSRQVLEPLGAALRVEPVRGQIVLLSAQPLPFRHVINDGPRYLVPRPDGRILVGSTEEHAGFEKRNTAAAIAGLIEFAVGVVPALAEAAVERTWCGLRPGSADGLPYLGRVPDTENLFVAAGHFRSGLQMSPATGRVMRQLMLEEEPEFSLAGLEPERTFPARP
ncbi:MAG: glycine oxidase ThiO [Planctomycetes bacterium]|nr:glycine oxidase ThiO [Planctomycetota bacterium]